MGKKQRHYTVADKLAALELIEIVGSLMYKKTLFLISSTFCRHLFNILTNHC